MKNEQIAISAANREPSPPIFGGVISRTSVQNQNSGPHIKIGKTQLKH